MSPVPHVVSARRIEEIFMPVAGANFALNIQLFRGKPLAVWRAQGLPPAWPTGVAVGP